LGDERDFTEPLAENVRLRARFRTDRRMVVEFVVQLEVYLNGEWRAVIRYDNAHGKPHLDILDRWGRQKHKHWIVGSNNQILTEGMNDIRLHWVQYVSRFVEE
jgi:hypothetical protein